MIFTKASDVNDSFFGKSQEPIRLMLEKDIEAAEKVSAIPHLFMETKSNNFAEKFTSKTSLENFEIVGEGGAYPSGDVSEGFSKVIEPYTWKQSLTITQEMIEDNKMLDIKSNALGFAQSYTRTKEMYAAALFANATSTSGDFMGHKINTACADGTALFSANHGAKGKGKAQSNIFSNGIFDGDGNISVDKAYDSLAAGETAMSNFKDDNGYVLSLNADTIIIPNIHSLKKTIFAIIGADKDPGTANNGFNYQFGRWNVIVWNYLNNLVTEDNPAPFILCDSKYNKRAGGAVWVDRVPLNVKSYIDENNDNNIFKGRSRFAAGFNNWRPFLLMGAKTGTELK
jgi:hypothetical protein